MVMVTIGGMAVTSQRQLLTFPLSPAVRAKLSSAGFLTVGDINSVKPSQLSKESGITLEEALEVTKIVSGEATKKAVTHSALQLLEEEEASSGIVTFCAALDEMLGGGVAPRKVTEICGAPGVGKTQMCIQLTVDASIPVAVGGVGGEAVYIDTEGSFIIERVVDIATATVDHCRSMAEGTEAMADLEDYGVEQVLGGIHYFRCHDHTELLATVHFLTSFIQAHPKVRVVVVDSVAFPFRHSFQDLSLRTRLLASLSQTFVQLATRFSLSVVVTNQMTTHFSGSGEGGSLLKPALGESWAHAATVRVVLFWDRAQRYALLFKSPSSPQQTVTYQITTGGIRDVLSSPDVQDVHTEVDGIPSSAKRPRLQ